MDDGKVNALSLDMLAALNGALDQALEDKVTVVLTGREGVFSGGFHLGTFKEGGEALYKMLKGGAELAERIMSFPTPVVAASTGHAIAMGSFLVMSADVRIGAAGNFKYVCNEVAIGLTLPVFAIEIAKQRLTPPHYNLALNVAHTYGPEQAVEAGFIDRVVPAAELHDQATQLATALSQLNMPAHAASKLLVREQALAALRASIERELASFEVFLDTMGRAIGAS